MADITADKKTKYSSEGILNLSMKGSSTLYAGSMVSTDATGYAVKSGDVASEFFQGVAQEQVANAGADGAKRIEVRSNGIHYFVTSGLTIADIGKQVYAVDNQTVALAATTTNDVLVGVIVDFVSATEVGVNISRR